ncbi:MAG: L-ribulose-5-phosphate 4-epimerase AraD [Candidatus Aminicenantes bacterium]|nr:L-ribulose-5-phosphate 4-epimerase AraD [Candidatus Aminicenantes bacterium]
MDKLKASVLQANRDLVDHGLVVLTFGNASGIDRKRGLLAIKPSGVGYETMKAEDIVLVDRDGKIVEGKLRPSSDTPTHLVLYRAFPWIGGLVHAHSPAATAFAQARRSIPCLGTTHADHFAGPVPVTRLLRRAEVEGDYEIETGKVIIERFAKLDPAAMPAVLVAGHGPFVWGRTPEEAVHNAVALELVAAMALATLQVEPRVAALPEYLLRKHHQRKHGPRAYYGQK